MISDRNGIGLNEELNSGSSFLANFISVNSGCKVVASFILGLNERRARFW